jgi:putative redox protein
MAPAKTDAIVLHATGKGRFQVEAQNGTSTILVDEPVASGGTGLGPSPYDLLATALGACTLMTIRLYVERKGIHLQDAKVRVSHSRDALHGKDNFKREILLQGALTDEQRTRILQVADRCPVHMTMTRGSDVSTSVITNQAVFDGQAVPDCQHAGDMSEACG